MFFPFFLINKIQDKRKELIEFNHKTQYIYNDISNTLLLKVKKN